MQTRKWFDKVRRNQTPPQGICLQWLLLHTSGFNNSTFTHRLLESLRAFGNSVPLASNASENREVYIQDNFVIQVQDVGRDEFMGDTFNVTINLEGVLDTKIKRLANTLFASVKVPASIFDNEDNATNLTQRLSYRVFRTDILFQTLETDDEDVEIGSLILGVGVNGNAVNQESDKFQLTFQKQDTEVSICLWHLIPTMILWTLIKWNTITYAH